jgi:hypothetical protein
MTVHKPRAKPRHSLRSPEREQAIVNALRVGNTRRAAAAAAEVSKDTFYRWLEDATFCDAVEKAEADAELRFLGVIAKAAPIRWQAAAWWLDDVATKSTDAVTASRRASTFSGKSS